MTEEIQLSVSPETAADSRRLAQHIARLKAIDARTIKHIRILRRSIDARQKHILVNLSVRLYINEEVEDDEFNKINYREVNGRPTVVVIGEGPAGLFASLRLIELGFRPVVIERGKNVRERKKDLSLITRTQKVDPESNYSFGEGGAGAYSDGKLYTRSKKRGDVNRILNIFCQHGAPLSILSDAHPHIGTDKLPRVIENMRLQILRCGGSVHFQTLMKRFILQGETIVGVEAVDLITGKELEFHGPVILATGHSARDVYRYLASARVEIEPKGIAVGVRLEHPSHLIDQIMYHSPKGRGDFLPAAEYNMVTQVNGRGVYSFCMCPGGFVVPAATGPKQIVVNGMSPSNRGTRWSNSGMVVETHPEDLPGENVLKVMDFQERLEETCWEEGNRLQTAPAQRMRDFVDGRPSASLPQTSYAPGVVSSRLDNWLPEFVSHRLIEGFKIFGHRHKGFLTNEAVLIAVETRTSSPVRILRSPSTLQHIRIHGLFPCGEGAGYAGGIVSAGIDGERCAESAAAYLQQLS